MDILIDSSALIAAERGAVDLDALLRAHAADEVGIAAITASELCTASTGCRVRWGARARTRSSSRC